MFSFPLLFSVLQSSSNRLLNLVMRLLVQHHESILASRVIQLCIPNLAARMIVPGCARFEITIASGLVMGLHVVWMAEASSAVGVDVWT